LSRLRGRRQYRPWGRGSAVDRSTAAGWPDALRGSKVSLT